MISARNYAAQAEKGLRRWMPPQQYDYYDKDMRNCELIAKQIKKAVHFALPDNGKILDNDLKGLKGVHARLPFPCITVEYFVEYTEGDYHDEAPVHAPRRLVLAIEHEKEGLTLYDDEIKSCVPLDLNFPDEKVIQLFVVNEVGGVWLPIPVSWVMPVTWDYSPPEGFAINRLPPLIKKKTRRDLLGSPFIVLPGFFKLMCEHYGETKAMQQALHDIGHETRAILELCEALTCSNVSTETVQHENKKANAKRVKKGKLPIYETRILTIETPQYRDLGRELVNMARRGPRQHLRRGHIRTLRDGRRIWINACVVGSLSLGRIHKDYNISKLSNSNDQRICTD